LDEIDDVSALAIDVVPDDVTLSRAVACEVVDLLDVGTSGALVSTAREGPRRRQFFQEVLVLLRDLGSY